MAQSAALRNGRDKCWLRVHWSAMLFPSGVQAVQQVYMREGAQKFGEKKTNVLTTVISLYQCFGRALALVFRGDVDCSKPSAI